MLTMNVKNVRVPLFIVRKFVKFACQSFLGSAIEDDKVGCASGSQKLAIADDPEIGIPTKLVEEMPLPKRSYKMTAK